MNKTRQILTSLLAALSLIACAGDVLPATDETLKAELEIITPVVGYGGNFEALLMCSSESIVFTEVDCRYPILVNGSELNRYETYNMSGSGLRLTTAALRAEADTEVTLHLTLKDQDSGQTIKVNGPKQRYRSARIHAKFKGRTSCRRRGLDRSIPASKP